MCTRAAQRRMMVGRLARARRVRHQHGLEAHVRQADHGLQHADVGLAPRHQDRLARGRQPRLETRFARGREVHLLERGLHDIAQGIHRDAQHLAVMLGGDPRHIEQARRLCELVRRAQHGIAIVDDRHQPALHVDDEQRGIGGLQQHVRRLLVEGLGYPVRGVDDGAGRRMGGARDDWHQCTEGERA
ncbi:hypothetical protein G6F68_017399 [Rhizopus microsporus]|nr:hypothetical protein G6F68_017399 [Rhizopus microsporus]